MKNRGKGIYLLSNTQTGFTRPEIAVGMDALYIHTEISPALAGPSKAAYTVMDGDFRKVRELLSI